VFSARYILHKGSTGLVDLFITAGNLTKLLLGQFLVGLVSYNSAGLVGLSASFLLSLVIFGSFIA
jgi:hypothetical protein